MRFFVLIFLCFSFLGKSQTLEEIEKQRTEKMKPVVVLFSTEWCGVCRIQKKDLKKLPQEFWDRIYFLSIDPEKYKKDILFFGKKYSFVSNGVRGLHQIAYEWAGQRVPAYPFWVFIDENQQIQIYEGMLKTDELVNIFNL